MRQDVQRAEAARRPRDRSEKGRVRPEHALGGHERSGNVPPDRTGQRHDSADHGPGWPPVLSISWPTRCRTCTCADIQCDEVWSFVGCKEKTAFFQNAGEGCGDAYIFTAIERSTKLLFCFHVGRRDRRKMPPCSRTSWRCAAADTIRPHVSTDGYNPYHTAIPAAFGHNVDHGMLIKQYASPTGKGQQRYSPATIIGAKHYQNAGTSQPGQICTSHIERQQFDRSECRIAASRG